MTDRNLTQREVAERCRVHINTIRNWRNDPDLKFPQPSYRVRRTVRFSELAIEVWLKEHRPQADGAAA